MVRIDRDPWLRMKQVSHYVRKGEFLECVSRGEKKGIRTAAGNFVAKGRRVYYCGSKQVGSSSVKKRLVVVDKEKMEEVLQELHDRDGHRGTRSTQYKVSKIYYWPTITQDIKDWVRKCPTCQPENKVKTETPELPPIKVEGRWDVLAMDVIGPLIVTPRGNKFILALTDLYTKWIVTYPLKDRSGQSVAMAIMEMIYTYGPPLKIITSQGSGFVSEVNKCVSSFFDIKRLIAYHQLANEHVKETSTALAKLCRENLDEWDKFIKRAVYGINTRCQATTQYSPFFLMHFRDAKCKSEINALHKNTEGVDLECVPDREDQIVADKIKGSTEICQIVEANIKQAQKKRKTDFDARKEEVTTFRISNGDKD